MRTLNRLAVAGMFFFAAQCGTSESNSKDWGEETEKGPRVHGTNLGMVSVEGESGIGYDVDGDGRADEIDLDGDGISDGEDIDNDGVISLWKDLRGGGAELGGDAKTMLRASDPDDFRQLDPRVMLLHTSSSGQVDTPATSNFNGHESAMAVTPTQPRQLSWGGDVLYPLNQQDQGSCTAFSNAALVTLLRYRRERATNMTLDANTLWASPSYIYTRILTPKGCNEGTATENALDLFVRQGSATLTEQPYRSGTMPMLCEPKTPEVATAPHNYRIGSWQRFTETGTALRARVKEAIAAGTPVPLAVNLPDGFQAFRETTAGVNVREVFRNGGMCTTSVHCGGHAMLITGYDDSRGAYRVLNSWGGDWGDRGYLWWDYAALESGINLAMFQVILSPDAPAPLPAVPPETITMTQPPGSQPVLRKVGADQSLTLFVRVQFNDPVTVTKLRALVGTSAVNMVTTSTLSYGDLGFELPSNDPPAPGTMIELTVTGTNRAGGAVEQKLTVPAPALKVD